MTKEAASARRAKSVRWAVASSLFSKFGTALLQLLSIPIAIRVLGKEEFGIYSTVSLAISTVILLQVGIGPALTHGISRSFAKGRQKDEQAYYSTSLALIIALALLAGGVLSVVFLSIPVVDIFGPKYAPYEDTLRSALWLGMIIILCQFVVGHTEKAREGYLEAWVNNLWGAGGNIVSAIAVGAGIFFAPSVHYLILAIYLPNILARSCNTIQLWIRRPYLRPSISSFRKSLVLPLLTDGIAFTLAFSMACLVEFNFGAFLLGRVEGPGSVAVYNILIIIDTLLIGIVLMFTTPIWPAIVDALGRGELDWIRRTALKLRACGTSYALAVGLTLTLLGPFFIPVWLGNEIVIPQSMLFAFSVYFCVVIWNHINHSLLIGIGKVKQSCVLQVVESLLVLSFMYFVLNAGGLEAMLWMMAALKAAVTGIGYTLLYQRSMKRFEAGEKSGPASPEKAVTPVANPAVVSQ